MITVHHLNQSRSQRVLWLLEELELPYTVKHYTRNPHTMLAPPELKAVHPLGKSPVISDNDQVIAESGAIVEYLLARTHNETLRPDPLSPEGQRVTYWLHYAEGSAMPPLLLSLVFNRLPQAPMPFLLRPLIKAVADQVQKSFVTPQLKQHIDYLEAHLQQHLWFAGSAFSAADIQMSFPVEAALARGVLGSEYSRLHAYLERIHARPAYQRALATGGPYELLS
ncbi:MAG: glutathione S-transferase [Candidatus Sericytochromatia bacterium]